MNDATIRLWARVLRSIEDSHLLLLVPEGSPRDRVTRLLQVEGIGAERVAYAGKLPRPEYLALHHRIDLGLDTLPYNGHTTSLDAYWMGVPIVTLVGQTVAGRAGWSQLSNLGLTGLAAQTPDEFVRVATNLARDLPRLAALRAELRGRMERSPLMDAPRFARHIEAAYRAMWRQWCESARRGDRV